MKQYRFTPRKPTQRQIRASLAAQAPLDAKPPEMRKAVRRKGVHDDAVDWNAKERAELAKITPENYAKKHGNLDGYDTWSAIWPAMLQRYFEFERNFDKGLVPDRTTCGMGGYVSRDGIGGTDGGKE